MKYVIVYLIKGEAGRYQQKLIKKVGPMFGENYMIENPLPSHVTLKSPFETDKIKNLELILKEFVEKQTPKKIKIKGFGNFDRFVAFLNTNFSNGARNIRENMIKELYKLEWMKFHEYDLKWKPHATVAYGNTKKSFDSIWDYLQALEKPKFDLEFDNITILRKPKKYWQIYKEFIN